MKARPEPIDWDHMFSRLASATGWSWEYIGREVTLPVVFALYAYWRTAPPVNEILASFFGIEKQSKPSSDGDWEKFTAQFAAMPGAVKRVVPKLETT